MQSDLIQEILNLKDGDHLCLFYEKDPAEQMAALVPFIQDGLSKDEQFIYIADDQTVDELSERLINSGVSVGQECERGRLNLWTRREWRQPGTLDSASKSAQVRGLIEQASLAGFKGIRFAVEMTWTLGPDISADELEHWEATINTIFLPGLPGRIVCQYNRSRLAPEVFLAALHTHPLVILGDQVCPNIFYQAPLILNADRENSNGKATVASRIDWMISQLLRARAAEREREELVRHRASLEAAEAGRKRIECLLNSMVDGFLSLDTEWRFAYVNKAAEQILGKPAAELIGNNFWDRFPAALGSKLELEYRRAAAEQVRVGLEYF